MKIFLVRIAILLGILAPMASRASLFTPFDGFADLANVHAEIDDRSQDTFRREINGSFRKLLAPRLDLRLSARYYRFDQDLDLTLGTYREEFQPAGELRWTHPDFLFRAGLRRRRVTTGADLPIVTNQTELSFQTRKPGLPRVVIGYDEQHTYYPDDPALRDLLSRRFQAGVSHTGGSTAASYHFTRLRNENIISGLSSLSYLHVARWNGETQPGRDGRLVLGAGISSQYQDQRDQVLAGGVVLERIPPARGLFLVDDDPGLDPLDEVPGLIDGDTDRATDPVIDIGGTRTDVNLGVDLGAPVPVAGLYIYTDRPSGEQVRWRVFVSDDNLTWESWDPAPAQVFNPALNRYELGFAVADRRYLKAVNEGLNEVAVVLVTEIEVLRQREAVAEQRRMTFVNLLDGRASYRFSKRWLASLDGSFQHSEIMGATGDRTRTGLGARVAFSPSRAVSHHWNLGFSGQNGNGDEATQKEWSLGYAMLYKLLPGWRGVMSASGRFSDLDGSDAQDTRGVSLDNTLALLPGLDLDLTQGLSRTDDHLGDVVVDTWYARSGVDALPRDNLRVTLAFRYQESSQSGSRDDTRRRRTGELGLDWRPGSRLYLRMNLQGVSEREDTVVRDILMGWNVLPAVRFSGQFYDLRTGGVITSRRKSVNMNIDLSRRSYLYLRLAEVDLSGGGGSKTVSYQQGFRMGF